MAKNTGKKSEKIWEDKLAVYYGKMVFIYNIPDTGDIKGLMTAGFVKPAPADYLVVCNGATYFAEVKSCSSKASFSFSQFTPSQNAAMLRTVTANGQYWIFIHNLLTDTWYMVPAELVLFTKRAGKQSLKWSELENHKWKICY